MNRHSVWFAATFILMISGCGSSSSGGGANSLNSPPSFAGIALAAATDTTIITVAWLAAQDDTTPPAQIKYNIYVSTSPQFTPSAATLNQSVTGVTQTNLTGLISATTYYIQVVAIDQQGLTISDSNSATAVTTLTNPVVLSTTTPLVKAIDLNLSSPTISGTTYTFPSTAGATLPAVGSVLVGTDTSGDGYLVNVTSASNTGGNIVVQTSQAVLSDAVIQGEISTTSTLFENPISPNTNVGIAANLKSLIAPSNIPTKLHWENNLLTFEENPATNLPSGISVKKNPATGRYNITASQASGSGSTTDQNTAGVITKSGAQPKASVLTGSSSEEFGYDVGITFTPQIITDAQWSSGTPGVGVLQKGVLMASGTLSLDAKAFYNFQTSSTYTKDVSFPVFTRTYTSLYQVGTLPIYQQITFTLAAQLTATAIAEVNATTDANISQAVSFGVQYDPVQGVWNPVSTSSNSKSLTADLSINGGVSSQIRLIPNIEVKFYKFVAGNLSVEPVLFGNIQASSITNADFLAGSFPSGITELTAFDSSLNAECYVGANLQFISLKIPLLSKTQVCNIPVATFFSLPSLALDTQLQSDGTNLLTATVINGANDPFNDDSIQWTIYPTNAGTIVPVAGSPKKVIFTFNSGVNSATIFFSGYGKLGELGRQFAQTSIAQITLTIPSIAQGGLTWQATGVFANWTNANDYCNSMTINGTQGWRLPTLAEILALYNEEQLNSIINSPQEANAYLGASIWTSTAADVGNHYFGRYNNVINGTQAGIINPDSTAMSIVCVQ